MATFIMLENSDHDTFYAEVCDEAIVIRDSKSGAQLFALNIMLIADKNFKENADKLKEHVLNALADVLESALSTVH